MKSGYKSGSTKNENKKKDSKYSKNTTKKMKSLGIEDEEDVPFLLMPGYNPINMSGGGIARPNYIGGAPMGGLEKSIVPYNLPPSMMQEGAYSPQRATQIPYQAKENTSNACAIGVNYTSSDGTQYQMSVVTPQQNRGKAVNNIMSALYGLMSGEYNSGQNYAGKSGKSGGSNYSAGKSGK